MGGSNFEACYIIYISNCYTFRISNLGSVWVQKTDLYDVPHLSGVMWILFKFLAGNKVSFGWPNLGRWNIEHQRGGCFEFALTFSSNLAEVESVDRSRRRGRSGTPFGPEKEARDTINSHNATVATYRYTILQNTVNPQIRLAGLILFSWNQMRVLLEIEHFCLLFFKFSAGLIRIRVLLEGESYLRIYGTHNCQNNNFNSIVWLVIGELGTRKNLEFLVIRIQIFYFRYKVFTIP